MEKVTTISNTIYSVVGAVISIGTLIYCYKIGKDLFDDLDELKD